jgi:HEAT repeat protein
VDAEAGLDDWHALLLLLARAPEELIAEGGIAKAWTDSGRQHFEIREIDYAELLRERAGSGDSTEWDAIIAHCLQDDVSAMLDEGGLELLLATLGDPEKFGALIDRLQDLASGGDATVGGRAAALLQMLKRMLDATSQLPREQGEDVVLQTAADAAGRLTADMMLALIQRARSAGEDAPIASGMVGRMSDGTIASFVAGSVVAERGASARLAQALGVLVPELERKEELLDLAREEARQTPLGREAGFENLWTSAAEMLKSYTDESFVSDAYARELSGARSQAIEVDRVSDDPPERVEAWLSTIAPSALKELDYTLLLDLLRVERNAAAWQDVAALAIAEVDRLVVAGAFSKAEQLMFCIVREAAEGGREGLRAAAEAAMDALATGPVARHIVAHLRRADEAEVEILDRLCHTIGPPIIRPLAEALAVEDNNRAIRRLRELLVGFGAAGRQSVEQLKVSTNPAVRRMAIDLLRVFGGLDALPELASMLHDKDPQVQREAIRAIVQIGSPEAFEVLQHALVASTKTRDTIVQELIGLRDEKVVPLLCYVLNHSAPRGSLVAVHTQIIEALAGLRDDPESRNTLQSILYRGEWWAPFRTAALRRAAAAALRRIGSDATFEILDEAARSRNRGVRAAARLQQARVAPQRERQRT